MNMSQSTLNRDQVVSDYAPLVEKIARRLLARLPANVELDDLKSAGFIGLLDAAEKFSDDKGTPFSVYAEIRIRGAMMDELRSQDWVPRSVRDRSNQLKQAIRALEEKLGRDPSDHEIAAELEVSVDQLNQLRLKAEIKPLVLFEDLNQRRAARGGERDVLETFSDPEQLTPDLHLEAADQNELLLKAMKTLTERKRIVLQLYYFEEMKLREIGDALGVTESRVCQIQSEALGQLKLALKRLVKG